MSTTATPSWFHSIIWLFLSPQEASTHATSSSSLLATSSSVLLNDISILSILQNNTNNNTNSNTTRCHSILFNPSFSIESNPKFEYSICPDTILVPLFTSATLFISMIFTCFCLIGILVKRKSGHVMARTPSMMISSLVASAAFVFISTIRYLVGRKIFPCALFSLTWFLTQPLVTLPTILRSARLFVMYRLNLIKTSGRRNSSSSSTNNNIFVKFKLSRKTIMMNHSNNNNKEQLEQPQQTQEMMPVSVLENHNNNNNNGIPNAEEASPAVVTTTSSSNEELISHHQQQPQQPNNNNNNSSPTTTSSSPSMMALSQDTNKYSVVPTISTNVNIIPTLTFNSQNNHDDKTHPETTTTTQPQPSTTATTPRSVKFQPLAETSLPLDSNPPQPFHDSSIPPNMNSTPTPTPNNNEFSWNDSISDTFDSVSEIASNYEPHSLDELELRRLRVLQFFSSHKFTIMVYSICLVLALGLWILLGAIEEGIHATNPNQNVIVDDGGLFLFTRGCITNSKTVGLIVAQAAVYILMEMVTLVLCVFADKDTWRIKIETFVVVIFQVVFVIVYGCAQINGYATLVEFIFPSGNIMATLTVIDVFICVVLPLFYAIVADYKKTQLAEFTDLEKILRNKKMCGQLLEFARKSYCPENILCYRDIGIFERMKSASGRRKMATFILKNYLNVNSPLELNIPKKETRVDELKLILEKKETLEKHQLNHIKMHCLTNMQDIFERFKENNPSVNEFLSQQNPSTTHQ